MSLVVGVDCSTTAAKAVAWTERGEAVAMGRASLSLRNPEPEGYEQDADEWWTATLSALFELCGELGARRREIVGLCVTHQRETVVVTDAAGNPRHPALVWMDARCHQHVASAAQRLGATRIHELSGKPPCTTPSLYKLLWLLERVPELRSGPRRVLDVHGLLCWRLTGRFATGLACADPLGLVDLQQRRWAPELLELLELRSDELPELLEPGEQLGVLLHDVARATGLPEGLPVFAGAGDGQAAGFGAGIDQPGRAYLNLGTAIVSGVLSSDYLTSSAFRTMIAATPEHYFLETDLKGGTFTLTWLREKLLAAADDDTFLPRLESAAAHLAPGSEGLLLVPYWNGVMNPYWDDDASGLVVGWRGHHGQEHMYRAVLEGIALEQRLHLEAVETAIRDEGSGPVRELVALGGGSKSDLWCQILADVLGKPLLRASSPEATALGAGMLAAVGAGIYASTTEASAQMTRTLGERFVPGSHQPHYAELYGVYRELYPALRRQLQELARLSRRAGQ